MATRIGSRVRLCASAMALMLIAACGSGGSSGDAPSLAESAHIDIARLSGLLDTNRKPAYIRDITVTEYDGLRDDLLTAGLGRSGLEQPVPPAPADPLNPTAAELRRLAIYSNYRGLLDLSASGGFGRLYGPNIDPQGADTLGEGKIAGTEYIAYSDDGSGRQNVMMMVQVPSNFDIKNACIVTGPSSGSSGVYGAIATSGEWGLKRGCAVAYTDKGTGTGLHDLQNNTVNLQTGVRTTAEAAGSLSNFTADLSQAEREAFNAATPNRFAFKHAHSQQNPERDWGKWTLQSVEFAFYVLNQQYGVRVPDHDLRLKTVVPGSTIVIASSASNGGGASIAAAELDTEHLIDGVAVAEPNVQLPPDNRLTVQQGPRTWLGTGRTLYDRLTIANLLQPCAALAPSVQNAPLRVGIDAMRATNRCHGLRDAGLITGNTTEELATSALNGLIAAGWEPESNELHASYYQSATNAIVTSYANAYGRFSVKDNLCGISFGAVSPTGQPVPASPAAIATSFGTSDGFPPTSGIGIINNLSVGGPLSDPISISPSNGKANYNLDAAFCFRELATGSSANAKRVQQGISEVLRSANLHGIPTLIVHGRSDAMVPVPFTSRPYFGLNKIVEGPASQLSYIEVTNVQHFDSSLGGVPGYAQRFVPLNWYYIQSMNLMYAHLKSGAPLPSSQLVRTVPRGVDAQGGALPITLSNLPAIQTTPAPADQITFSNNVVSIPD